MDTASAGFNAFLRKPVNFGCALPHHPRAHEHEGGMMPVVLVVEDEPNIRQMIVELLGQLRHEVRVAGTAAEAVATATAQRPDAILLDIVLPDARGTTLLDQLRKLRPDVPIVMVTAHADEALARETLKRGAFDYITKPFDLERLKSVLEAALA